MRTHPTPSSPATIGTATRVVLPGLVEPDGLVVEQVAIAQPGPGELLVAVEATGISYAEQSMRRGRYVGQPAFPFVPGYDLVGTVLDAGEGADAALVGRRVATMTKTGAWTSHAVVSARDTVVVPDGIDPAAAEAVVVNGVTAWQMLRRAARVQRGQTVLVHGANGGVGGILVQLAHLHGVRVIGSASPRHHDTLRAAGVEPVDYADPHLAERVRELAPDGLDAVFDNVGGEMMHTSWALLAPHGTLVQYSLISAMQGAGSMLAPFARAVAQLAWWNLLPNGRRATFYNLWSGHTMRPARFRRHLEADLGRVFGLLVDGAITANVAATFPLSDVAEAMTLAESRTRSGKVVLLP